MQFRTLFFLILSPCVAWAFLSPRVSVAPDRPTVTTSSSPCSCWMAESPKRRKKLGQSPKRILRPLDRIPIDRGRHGPNRENDKEKMTGGRRSGRQRQEPRNDDDDDNSNIPNLFPENLRCGDEIDVRIVKTMEKYALCRPLDFPYLKGKISVTEMDEYTEPFEAQYYVKERLIYRAYVMDLVPPDRILFSLRRVRRVVRDDFQPFTICLFNVPYDLTENEIKALMDGEVLDVALPTDAPEDREDVRSFAFVTFLHEADGVAAIRKWSATKMPCMIGDQTKYFTVRAKKSNRQDYRERLQARLDDKYYERLERWNETPYERRGRLIAERDLLAIIPWYIYDRDNTEFDERMGFLPKSKELNYTIKNNPRTHR